MLVNRAPHCTFQKLFRTDPLQTAVLAQRVAMIYQQLFSCQPVDHHCDRTLNALRYVRRNSRTSLWVSSNSGSYGVTTTPSGVSSTCTASPAFMFLWERTSAGMMTPTELPILRSFVVAMVLLEQV